MTWKNLRFEGDGLAPKKQAKNAYKTPEPYIPSPDLITAVNLAIFLGRPLLLEGEAGSGKSRLARAVAYELGLPLQIWPIRSGSHALDGLYSYDAILRLHDVHVKKEGAEILRDPSDPKAYREFGKLGKAFIEEEAPTVVLIDEIDKADVDFPNDLLTVLEDRVFDIPETGEKDIAAKFAPIVIITSNKEKGNLPKPFLRRCIYKYVHFPRDEKTLIDIINLHAKERGEKRDKALVKKAVTLFQHLRDDKGLQKLPGTSELLDWITALHSFSETKVSLPEEIGPDLPYLEVLLKLRTDFARI